MTPEELDLITTTSDAIRSDPARFSASFYDTLFELEPATRELFATDMDEQRQKLVGELQFLIDAATAWRDPDSLDEFVERSRNLGRRHVTYGVSPSMYGPVNTALLATLRDTIRGFDDRHHQAWTKLFHLVSETMLEGTFTAAPKRD